MKVIIAGSRTVHMTPTDIGKVVEASGFNVDVVISGGARGADHCGELWALKTSTPVEVYPADWDKYGKSAGYKRNKQMSEVGDALIALWDGKSRGTKHMIAVMQEAGKPVYLQLV